MRTRVRVADANCPYCMNDVRDELLSRPLVHGVHTSAVAGCLEVDHDHDDPGALIAVLQRSLHGWQIADNGEVVMVMTHSELDDECPWHPPAGGN